MAQRSGCSARGAGTARAVGSRVSAQDLGGTCSALVFPLALAQAAEFCFSLPLVFEVWAGRGGTILGLKNHWNTEERVVWVGEFSDAIPSWLLPHRCHHTLTVLVMLGLISLRKLLIGEGFRAGGNPQSLSPTRVGTWSILEVQGRAGRTGAGPRMVESIPAASALLCSASFPWE